MKCNKCEFEHCESNEYGTEYSCAVFGDDVPEEFQTNGGCNLRHDEAKKYCELKDKCIEKYYDSMYVLCVLSDGNPTKEQQAEIDRIDKDYSLASKKLNNYYDVLVNRRKKMIRLQNNYAITSSSGSFALVTFVNSKDKEGNEIEIQKPISYHTTLESALQSYSNNRMADLVSNVDLDLKQVKEAINELKEELKAYE